MWTYQRDDYSLCGGGLPLCGPTSDVDILLVTLCGGWLADIVAPPALVQLSTAMPGDSRWGELLHGAHCTKDGACLIVLLCVLGRNDIVTIIT